MAELVARRLVTEGDRLHAEATKLLAQRVKEQEKKATALSGVTLEALLG